MAARVFPRPVVCSLGLKGGLMVTMLGHNALGRDFADIKALGCAQWGISSWPSPGIGVRMPLTSVISLSPVQVGMGFDNPFNQFVASFVNPLRSKNARSIDNSRPEPIITSRSDPIYTWKAVREVKRCPSTERGYSAPRAARS